MPQQTRPAILIVEDDELMCDYMGRYLKKMGYDVYTTSNGLEGIAIFNIAGDHIHVVASDIVMPNMDGIEFCQSISATARHIFEFIFITGFAAVSLKAGRACPQVRVLNKPFHLRDFVNEIDRVMVRVIHKRKRLIEKTSGNINEKLDKILESIESRVIRDAEGLVRSESKTIIYGSGNTISIDNDFRSVKIVNNIIPGDFSTLETALSEIGISQNYIAELKIATELDCNVKGKRLIGENSERWLKRTLRSVGKGTTKVAGDIATSMLTKIISTYFGITA